MSCSGRQKETISLPHARGFPFRSTTQQGRVTDTYAKDFMCRGVIVVVTENIISTDSAPSVEANRFSNILGSVRVALYIRTKNRGLFGAHWLG